MPIDLYVVARSAPCRAVRLVAAARSGYKLSYVLEYTGLMAGEHLKPEFIKMNPQHTTYSGRQWSISVGKIMDHDLSKYCNIQRWFAKVQAEAPKYKENGRYKVIQRFCQLHKKKEVTV